MSRHILHAKLGACLNRCLMSRLPGAALSAVGAGGLARSAHTRRIGRYLRAQLIRVLALRRRGRALLRDGKYMVMEGLL